MAKIKDYGIVEVEKLDGAPKLVIKFEGGEKFESFFYKRDGDPNKKTLKTLFTCGFRGKDLSALAEGPASGLLDMDKEFDLDVEQVDGYWVVNWVNDPEKSQFSKNVDKKKFGGMKISKALSEIGAEFDAEEELPF